MKSHCFASTSIECIGRYTSCSKGRVNSHLSGTVSLLCWRGSCSPWWRRVELRQAPIGGTVDSPFGGMTGGELAQKPTGKERLHGS